MRTLKIGAIAGLLASVGLNAIGGASAHAAALLVGVDQYQDPAVQDLPAAARDAEDLATAVRAATGWTPTVLIGPAATKARILEAFQQIVHNSPETEPIIFGFAGHGAQMPDENGDEDDGLDEVFLLGNVSPEAPSHDEMLTDDEIDFLIRSAAPRPVLVIADSCHSGTVVRSADTRVDPPKNRYHALNLPMRGLGRIEQIASARASPPLVQGALLAAIREDFQVEEVLIGGEYRGALSWAVARGLEGRADTGDGLVTVAELASFVASTVPAVSDGRQVPVADVPSGAQDLVLTRAPIAAEVVGTAPTLDVSPLPIALVNTTSTPLDLHQLNVTIGPPETAELVLDVSTGEVITNSGDVAVDLTRSWSVGDFEAIIEKYRFLRMLSFRTDGRVRGSLSGGPRHYRASETLRVEIESDRPGDLILFALLADGTLSRIGTQAEPISETETISLPLRVGPPFGGDHIIAVVTSNAAAIADWLRSAQGHPLDTKKIAAFAHLLREASGTPVSIYTVPG